MAKKQNPFLHQPNIDNTALPPSNEKTITRLNELDWINWKLEKDEYDKYKNGSEILFRSVDEMNIKDYRGLGIDKVFIDECAELSNISFMSNHIINDMFKSQILDYSNKLKETLINCISKIIPECNEYNLFDYLKNVQRVFGKNSMNKEQYYYMISENEKVLLFETENKIEQTENGYVCNFYLKINETK